MDNEIADSMIKIIYENNHEIPVIISIPHSGLFIPQSMKRKLKKDVVLTNSDWYLSELYDFLESLGYTVISSDVNRYVIDVNRNVLQKEGSSYKTNMVYTITTQGDEIYDIPVTEHEIKKRMQNYYLPYHNLLKKSIEEKLKHFAKVYVVDLHSFGLNYGADVILGNNFNKSCSRELSSFFIEAFAKNGFGVDENKPYSGGYITKNYGKRGQSCEAIQIELWYYDYIQNRYFGKEELPDIDEKTFSQCKWKMKAVFSELKEWLM